MWLCLILQLSPIKVNGTRVDDCCARVNNEALDPHSPFILLINCGPRAQPPTNQTFIAYLKARVLIKSWKIPLKFVLRLEDGTNGG